MTWQPPTAASSWRIRYSPGMPDRPYQDGANWAFDFPRYDQPMPPPDGSAPLVGQSITLTIEVVVTGNPVFDFRTEQSNTGDAPAAVRLMLQRQGDDLSMAKEHHRWWSTGTNRLVLAPGIQTMTVPLIPSAWSNVAGKNGDLDDVTRAKFASCMKNIANFAKTFGGGFYFGHGANVRGGGAKYICRGLTIQ